MEQRLSFNQVGSANSYAIHNQKQELIGFVTRRRVGQFMQWVLDIPLSLMKECIEQNADLIFSPGCQDEIREKCKELKSHELKKCRKTKQSEINKTGGKNAIEKDKI